MKIPVKTSPKIDPIPQDSHHAICYGVLDLGSHYKEGQWAGVKHEVLILFELPNQRIEIEKDGEKVNLPRAQSQTYTYSMSDRANLRKDLQTWRGKNFTDLEAADFDLKELLGSNCILHVLHRTSKSTGNIYASIESITKLMPGMDKKTPENPTVYFSFDNGIDSIPETAPPWVIEKIKSSDEYSYIMDARSGADGTLEPSENGEDESLGDENADVPF